MRQIEFRAWDVKGRKWITNSVTISAEFRIFVMLVDGKGGFHCFTKSKEEVLIQEYTGLTDKTGRKIFEGDIVKFKKTPWFGDKEIGIVEFEPCSYYVRVPDGPKSKNASFERLDEWRTEDSIKVLGNVFENPELCAK